MLKTTFNLFSKLLFMLTFLLWYFYTNNLFFSRYLFQTLKHYPKPIIANINSAATGLAAALLSLVDIVYDQVFSLVFFSSSYSEYSSKLLIYLD